MLNVIRSILIYLIMLFDCVKLSPYPYMKTTETADDAYRMEPETPKHHLPKSRLGKAVVFIRNLTAS